MKRSLGLIVSGAILTAGLTFGNPVGAQDYLGCEEFGKTIAERLNDILKIMVFIPGNTGATFGGLGEVSPNAEYDVCAIRNFEENISGYTINATREDPRWGNGTTYEIVKKESKK
ncbi:MAG TPA: hypothetical protein VJ208_00325 [Candidatus Nanoarchaeia archaeon]|nr:hypothetical protein [Candidatus Nanoarchaeia archaeon]